MLELSYSGTTYDFSGQVISLQLSDTGIILQNTDSEQTILSFVNGTYAGTKEYAYTISPNKKHITVTRKRFVRQNGGTTVSSMNAYDEFEAVGGYNSAPDGPLSTNKNAQ